MNRLSARLALVPWLCTSFVLTGCPLSDHYSLDADGMGGADAGSAAGTSAAGDSASSGASGFGGDVAGALGGSANGGAPVAGNGGNSGAGGLGSAGLPEAGSPDMGGDAGQGVGGGSAGLGGSGGDSGSSGASGSAGASGGSGSSGASGAGGAACSALTCSYTCCGSTCADTTRAFDNCGVCGVSCNAPRSCLSSACTSGWVPMSPPPASLGLAARWRAASVAMGKSVFIWGGSDSTGAVLDSGAIYSTMTDTWTAVAKNANTPTARVFATAVWTGSVVVVFGGSDALGATPYKDGAVYDPALGAWSAIPMASKARSSAFGFWDGTRAIFWGGIGAGGAAVSGADRFDLSTWSAATLSGDPGADLNPAAAWDGMTMYLQGGLVAGMRTDKVFSYTSNTDTWVSLSKSLPARTNAFGVWDGARFVVWGGMDQFGLHNDGKYLASGGMWPAMSMLGAPSMRMAVPRRHGWAFQTSPGMIALFGGQTSTMAPGTFSTSGATYDVVNAKWGSVAAWPSGETHDYGVGVWTGDEFVLWGGRTGNGPSPSSTLTGERWKP